MRIDAHAPAEVDSRTRAFRRLGRRWARGCGCGCGRGARRGETLPLCWGSHYFLVHRLEGLRLAGLRCGREEAGIQDVGVRNLGVDVARVVWVWTRLEFSRDLCRRRSCLCIERHGLGPGIDLCRCVADYGVHPRVDKLGVVLVEHLAVDDGRVLDLLREARLEEEELCREDDLEYQAVEHRHARALVEGRNR